MLLRIAKIGVAGLVVVAATAAVTGAALGCAAAGACALRRRAKARQAWPEDEAETTA